MARLDPHSYNDSDQASIQEIEWRARVDFEHRILEGDVLLLLDFPAAGPLDLDTRDLAIQDVTDGGGDALVWSLQASEPVLGSRLRIDLPPNTSRLRIRYRTSPTASALQWLSPPQTSGGQEPFLFSQCQAIHARSVVPLQDTPRNRIRFRIWLDVPSNLKALVAAACVGREERNGRAVEEYVMPQSIPPYLLAFAVGDLVARDVGERSRVWAEPSVIEGAAWEFGGVDAMLTVAESLFGPYDWERFDILTMPQSFPYGGMENPRLTFLTPTLLAGDRSLVNVVAHELAHSWTGNLVSNASADHFWLNEGFTVFAERRILEALEGPDVAALHAALGRRTLDQAVAQFAEQPELTFLRTHLQGVDPDDAYSQVPYEKGYLFLRTLENSVGRTAFDAFLKTYLRTFRFRSITTEDFVALAEEQLPGALSRIGGARWLEGPGVPDNAPQPRSARLDALTRLEGRLPDDADTSMWSPTEWHLFIEGLPHPAPLTTCKALDERFKLSSSRNYEILVAWLVLAAESGYEPVLPRVEQVLGQVGRMKYLKPLYQALSRRSATQETAVRWFKQFEERYHPIARQVISGVLKRVEV